MIILKKRDALDTLKAIETNSVDLVLLDPYYNEWEEWIEKGILDQCFRIMKKSGNLLCFTQQPFDFDLRVALKDNFRREIIWHIPKRPKWVSNNMPSRQSSEDILGYKDL
jgi:DNA modification methylase